MGDEGTGQEHLDLLLLFLSTQLGDVKIVEVEPHQSVKLEKVVVAPVVPGLHKKELNEYFLIHLIQAVHVLFLLENQLLALGQVALLQIDFGAHQLQVQLAHFPLELFPKAFDFL